MKPCEAGKTMEQFGLAKTTSLLESAEKAIRRAAENPDEEAVHKMRVSIRRLQQAIRLFRQFLPKRGVKRVRADLKKLMKPAGELRNYDIALELLRRFGYPLTDMKERRIVAKHSLLAALAAVSHEDAGERWAGLLGLGIHEKETERETVEA